MRISLSQRSATSWARGPSEASLHQVVPLHEISGHEVRAVGQHRVQLRGGHTEPGGQRIPQRLPAGGRDESASPNVLRPGIGQIVRVVAENLSSLHGTPGDEHVATPGVVGSKAIAGERPAELGRRDDHHVVPQTLQHHLFLEALDRLIDLLEVGGQDAAHVRVRVEAAYLHVEGVALAAQLIARGDQTRHFFQLRRQPKTALGALLELLLQRHRVQRLRKRLRAGDGRRKVAGPGGAHDGSRAILIQLQDGVV
eukprot:scaffold1159_cov215-Pinguiococcus_pyrenoidosus.AAC.6